MEEATEHRRHRLNILTWERTRADIEDLSHRARLRRLETYAGATFADGVYIAENAEVHTDRLSMGRASWIAGHAIVRGEIELGEEVSVNPYACLSGKVKIGDGVRIASHVSIVGFNHGFDDLDTPIFRQPLTSKGIEIGDGVWIGANAVILDGVTVGAHAIIAAGAVVSQNIPPYSIAGGVPARVLKSRKPAQTSRRAEAEKHLKDLDATARREWQSVISNARSADIYLSPDASGTPVSTLRHTCDAIEIAAAFDNVEALGSKAALISFLQSIQDPETGLFPEPRRKRPPLLRSDGTALYNLLAVTYALECLGAAPLFTVNVVEDLSSNELVDWLKDLPWQRRAWHSGAVVDAIATGLWINQLYFAGGENRHVLFGWLLSHCNSQTGIWGEATEADGLIQPVNGFYRLTRGSHAQFGLPVPYPEKAIDTVIRNYREHDGFTCGRLNACNLLDTVHPLLLCLQQTTHRHDEARSIAEEIISTFVPLWQTEAGFPFAKGHSPGLQGTEMGLSLLWLAAKLAGLEGNLTYAPKGIHRFTPLASLSPR